MAATGFVDLAPIPGSIIFATGLIAVFFDTSTDNVKNNVAQSCIGADCFRLPFYISSFACIMAATLAYFIHFVTPMRRSGEPCSFRDGSS